MSEQRPELLDQPSGTFKLKPVAIGRWAIPAVFVLLFHPVHWVLWVPAVGVLGYLAYQASQWRLSIRNGNLSWTDMWGHPAAMSLAAITSAELQHVKRDQGGVRRFLQIMGPRPLRLRLDDIEGDEALVPLLIEAAGLMKRGTQHGQYGERFTRWVRGVAEEVAESALAAAAGTPEQPATAPGPAVEVTQAAPPAPAEAPEPAAAPEPEVAPEPEAVLLSAAHEEPEPLVEPAPEQPEVLEPISAQPPADQPSPAAEPAALEPQVFEPGMHAEPTEIGLELEQQPISTSPEQPLADALRPVEIGSATTPAFSFEQTPVRPVATQSQSAAPHTRPPRPLGTRTSAPIGLPEPVSQPAGFGRAGRLAMICLCLAVLGALVGVTGAGWGYLLTGIAVLLTLVFGITALAERADERLGM